MFQRLTGSKMDLILGLVGAILILIAIILYERGKRSIAEALLQNQQEKEKLNAIDQQISQNNGQLASEEEKRKQLEQDLKDKESKDASKDELLDFLNKPKSN